MLMNSHFTSFSPSLTICCIQLRYLFSLFQSGKIFSVFLYLLCFQQFNYRIHDSFSEVGPSTRIHISSDQTEAMLTCQEYYKVIFVQHIMGHIFCLVMLTLIIWSWCCLLGFSTPSGHFPIWLVFPNIVFHQTLLNSQTHFLHPPLWWVSNDDFCIPSFFLHLYVSIL